MGNLSETIEKHVKEVTNCERVNVMFYDKDKKALYKRLKSEKTETIKWIADDDSQGFSNICVAALSSFSCPDAQMDIRFNPELDDALARPRDNPAKSLLAVPMTSKENIGKDDMPCPVGVIVAINKNDKNEFSEKDLRDLILYASAAGKACGNTTKLEYFLSTNGPVGRMGEKTVDLINTMELTSDFIMLSHEKVNDLKELISRAKH